MSQLTGSQLDSYAPLARMFRSSIFPAVCFSFENLAAHTESSLVWFGRKERSWKDLPAMQVIRAHMWLQELGNLSTWTLSGIVDSPSSNS